MRNLGQNLVGRKVMGHAAAGAHVGARESESQAAGGPQARLCCGRALRQPCLLPSQPPGFSWVAFFSPPLPWMREFGPRATTCSRWRPISSSWKAINLRYRRLNALAVVPLDQVSVLDQITAKQLAGEKV